MKAAFAVVFFALLGLIVVMYLVREHHEAQATWESRTSASAEQRKACMDYLYEAGKTGMRADHANRRILVDRSFLAADLAGREKLLRALLCDIPVEYRQDYRVVDLADGRQVGSFRDDHLE